MSAIPDEAVHLVAERRLRRYESEYDAAHLTWRDFADDARADLEAAEAIVMGGATVETEWGCRYNEEYVQSARDEETARKIARVGKSLGHVLVHRTVTYGPWEEVPGGRVG